MLLFRYICQMADLISFFTPLSILIIIVFILVASASRHQLRGRKFSFPPGPPGFPVIGNVSFLFNKFPWIQFTQWHRIYGLLTARLVFCFTQSWHRPYRTHQRGGKVLVGSEHRWDSIWPPWSSRIQLYRPPPVDNGGRITGRRHSYWFRSSWCTVSCIVLLLCHPSCHPNSVDGVSCDGHLTWVSMFKRVRHTFEHKNSKLHFWLTVFWIIHLSGKSIFNCGCWLDRSSIINTASFFPQDSPPPLSLRLSTEGPQQLPSRTLLSCGWIILWIACSKLQCQEITGLIYFRS